MKIGNHDVGGAHRPFVIAEVAQTHDGSLGNALAFIDVAKDCGANAIKFQTHIASEESTPTEPWRIAFSAQDSSRYEYWKRMEFSKSQWAKLKAHADSRGIVFMSSPFSIRACEWLVDVGMDVWKIASGETRNLQLLDWIALTGKPVILSSGLSTVQETLSTIKYLESKSVQAAVLHCTTMYPTPPEHVGLNVMTSLASAVNIPFGLSDHSGTIYPAIAATYLGASIIEVHLTLHRQMFGPDVGSSLTPDELADLVKGVNFSWRMRMNAIDKESQLADLVKERSIFGRSLVAARNIGRGEVIVEKDLAYKKPGGGLVYEQRSLLVNKRAVRDVRCDHPLSTDDVQ